MLKKYQKKVMPFVQRIRDRVGVLGKAAMAVTVDFDEREIIETNMEYLKGTLDLESIEIRFTDDVSATENTKESVQPGTPFISYIIKPAVKVSLENPVPRSGLFTQQINVGEGDTVSALKEKLAKSLGLKITTAIQLWRYEDHVLGPRKMPVFNDFKAGKQQLEEGIFAVDVKDSRVFCSTSNGGKIEIGTNLIYVVE
jgi:leucyl-tRNA synthetase